MRLVSMVYDYSKQNFPLDNWTEDKYEWFKDIIERTKKLDEMMDQRDCVDPEKEKYMREIEDRLANLEKRILQEPND